MNTLANHGYLPHDGRNITLNNAIFALSTALNFDPALATTMWEHAIVANPEPNATFFTLENLNRHNVLEHDASMSRSDAHFGNNHIFNQTIFNTTRRFWTAETLTPAMLANGKLARQIESRAFNPDYTFTAVNEQFSLGEVAAPVIVFGDMEAGTVDRDLVEFFFEVAHGGTENERLPTELGWTKKVDPVIENDVLGVSKMISEATSLLTGSENGVKVMRQDLHSGIKGFKHVYSGNIRTFTTIWHMNVTEFDRFHDVLMLIGPSYCRDLTPIIIGYRFGYDFASLWQQSCLQLFEGWTRPQGWTASSGCCVI
ncbi:uncharacterized protein JN550_013765 [Neoarthrinium moseri]|uniref:uncharacterized protein n=1 Tax=Neoarthrinium moseri TaxID=1658444 RepID=UPI001FDDEA16|nr:uncharacterized protein JN550_013765 [Neoarthrinium moseri]KAI1856524.1 hypothetical protein JN550_013765 [Neoarthrinium moseri]